MVADTSEQVLPGFQNPALDSQAAFRVLLDGMSHPGRILRMPLIDTVPTGLDPAAAAVCLTLLDGDTVVWNDLDETSPVLSWLRFHCGCPLAKDAGRAQFGLVTEAARLPSLDIFESGTAEAPETAATLILQVQGLAATDGCRLSGPGIRNRHNLKVMGLPHGFWDQRQRACGTFPLGLDILFVCGAQLAALPRSTKTET